VYDLTVEVESDPGFRQQLAGHVENGRDGWSDPALGGSRRWPRSSSSDR
jgi:phospholipase C